MEIKTFQPVTFIKIRLLLGKKNERGAKYLYFE